ncbi:MAG: biotin--[acetyl-CoA-carboxylase] ligase [Enterococcus sp.]
MSTKERILHLLKATPDVFSGQKIAEELNISRTAVWKAIKELEKQGYHFAHEATGYRYIPTDILEPKEIEQSLKTQLSDFSVQYAASSVSTMDDAKMAILQNKTTPTLFLADMQTGAHGRFNRPFFAERGHGIYMSLLIHPDKSFSELPNYTVIAASACALAIEGCTGKSTEIKWVNDIFIGKKKVAGILSEAVSDMETGHIKHVIIGMGINFSIPQTNYPQDLQDKVTSIYPDEQIDGTRNQLIFTIWRNFFNYLADLPKTDYLDIYRKKSIVLNKKVTFIQQNKTYQGIATAITDQGELVVQLKDQKKILSSGEISLSSYT